MKAPVQIGDKTVTPLPRSVIYRNLIAHVTGQGPRHWYQHLWHSDMSGIPSEHRRKIKAGKPGTAFSESNVCGSFACIAGEVVTMHDITLADLSDAGSTGWGTAAGRLGVSPYAPDGRSLFAADRTLDEVLPELERRLAEAELAETSEVTP